MRLHWIVWTGTEGHFLTHNGFVFSSCTWGNLVVSFSTTQPAAGGYNSVCTYSQNSSPCSFCAVYLHSSPHAPNTGTFWGLRALKHVYTSAQTESQRRFLTRGVGLGENMMKSKEWVNSTMGLEGFIASVDSDGTREIEGSPGDLGELGGSRIDSQRGLIDGEEGGDCPGNVLDNQLGLDDEFLRQQSDVRSSVECGDDMCVRCEKDEGLDDGSVGTFGPVVRDGEQGEAGSGLEHLLVLVHGVSGVPECFSVLEKILGNQLPKEEVVLLASRVNSGGSSHDGIEVCGMRLAEEIKQVISENPGLKRISFMAHSIGGLFSRYAAGINYNEANGKIFDLEPWCFISIATPHLGCDVQGESQVGRTILSETPRSRAE